MLKIVVLGFGFMGKTHTGNILKNHNARLVAIVDKNKENIQKNLKEESGNFATGSFREEELAKVNLYTDFAECLAAEKPDACIIAVHTNLHVEMAELALGSGCHVFLEKPFTLDVEEGQKLIDLARTRNKVLILPNAEKLDQHRRIWKAGISFPVAFFGCSGLGPVEIQAERFRLIGRRTVRSGDSRHRFCTMGLRSTRENQCQLSAGQTKQPRLCFGALELRKPKSACKN